MSLSLSSDKFGGLKLRRSYRTYTALALAKMETQGQPIGYIVVGTLGFSKPQDERVKSLNWPRSSSPPEDEPLMQVGPIIESHPSSSELGTPECSHPEVARSLSTPYAHRVL